MKNNTTGKSNSELLDVELQMTGCAVHSAKEHTSNPSLTPFDCFAVEKHLHNVGTAQVGTLVYGSAKPQKHMSQFTIIL